MSIHYLNLDDEHAPFFVGLTFPNYAGVLENFDATQHLAVGAANDAGEPIGLVLAALPVREDETIVLLSLFVDEDYRNQGIGSQLIQQLQQTAHTHQHPFITGDFPHTLADVKALMRVFEKNDFNRAPDELYTVSGTIAVGMALIPPLGDLPDGFSFFDWADLSDEDSQHVFDYAREADSNGWLNPYSAGGLPVHEPTSVGLRDAKGQVVGWMVNHLVRAGVIRYTRLFLDPALRQQYLGVHCIAEAMRRHHALDPDSTAVFAAESDNQPMLRVINYFKDTTDVTFTRYITATWVGVEGGIIR